MRKKYIPAPIEVGLGEFLMDMVWNVYGDHWKQFSFHLFPLAGDQLLTRSQAEWYNGVRKWTPDIIRLEHKKWIRSQVRQLVQIAQADLPHVNGVQIHLNQHGLAGVDYVYDLSASTPELFPDLVAKRPLVNKTVIEFCWKILNQPGTCSIDFLRFTFFPITPGKYSAWFRYGIGTIDQIQLDLPPEVSTALNNLQSPPDWNVLQIDFDDDFRATIDCRHDPIIADLLTVQAVD